jgi:drug/metabolite transporter (DMT)-like permease
VLALSRASLAVVSALMMTAPLLIVTASAVLGWERARPRLLLGVALGLAGALLVLRPSAQSSGEGIALAGLCAVSLAARDLITRRLPPSMPSSLVAALTTCSVCVAAAVCAAIGNYALVAACRGSDLSVVTPFRYSLIVWACLSGFLVWGDIPDMQNTIGIAVIVAAGVLTLRAASRR